MLNKIREERLKLNFTQQELANKVGVSRQTINSLEGSIYIPTTVLALKLSKVFKIPVNAIFQLERDD